VPVGRFFLVGSGLLAAGLLGACATTPYQPVSGPQCIQNFTEQSGMANYRTTAFLDGVSRGDAVDRLVRALGRKGFVINDADRERGIVNATFDAGSSDIQLSAFLDRAQGGTDAELNYAGTGAGLGVMVTPAEAYRNELCQYVDAMAGAV
jgi:hypothetical protein